MTVPVLRRYRCRTCEKTRLGPVSRIPDGWRNTGKDETGDLYSCTTCVADKKGRERDYRTTARIPDMVELGVVKRFGRRSAGRRK